MEQTRESEKNFIRLREQHYVICKQSKKIDKLRRLIWGLLLLILILVLLLYKLVF